MGKSLPDRIGKYSVIRRIASGGMAEVFLCRLKGEEGFEKYVAVKRILPRHSSDPRFRELFIREARTAASLSHPNLVQVFDFGREGDTYYLAMEFIDGWNLAQVISRARVQGISIPLPIWSHWVCGILSGIGHLHSKGIVHRDISPSNVLLSCGGLVKVTDYGISLWARDQADTVEGLEGKFAYMSPEQVRGGKANTDSDLFAAAVIAAEIHLPNRLFGSASPAETIGFLKEFDGREMEFPGMPHEVVGVLRKALSGDRNARFGDAEEFTRAVRAVVPITVGRAEILAFWKGLFPDGGGEDENTIPMFPPAGQGERDIVREKSEVYGYGRRKRAQAGIISAIVVISAAGYGFWKGLAREAKQSALIPPAASLVTLVEDPKQSEGTDPSPLSGDTQSEVPSRKAATSGIPQEPAVAATVPSPSSGTVFLETDPPGASVSLENGTSLGKTPIGIDMIPWIGKKIVVHKEGYERKNVRADHLAQVKIFRLELERQTGSIEVIQAIPWARVYEGNKYIGDTPIHGLKLPVGVHRLRFLNEPLGIEKEREISVQLGANPKVIVPLVGKRPGG